MECYHTRGLVLILLLGIVVLPRWVVEGDGVLSYQGVGPHPSAGPSCPDRVVEGDEVLSSYQNF